MSDLSPEKRALLQQRLGAATRKRVNDCAIPKRPNHDAVPLSFSQRQIWVIDQMTPGNPAYNLPNGYRLRGPLDVPALERSVNEIIKRHEGLRTTFVVRDGEPVQRIHPDLEIRVKVTPLDHLRGEERENKLQALASEESLRSFDLSRLPLIRVSVFRLGAVEHVLILNFHHIVADGLSFGVFMRELDAFYRAYTGGADARPLELAVQYADFAVWQRQRMAGEAACADQIEFWQRQLAGTLPVLELPGDRPRPALQSFNGSNVFFGIPAPVAEDLKTLGAREGCTVFMTLLAAFQVLLQRYSGADDIVIGTPVAARTQGELDPLIGNFLNMAALRCDLSGDPAFIELLRRTRDTTLNAFSNSGVSFEALAKHLKLERDPSRNPVFQVILQVLAGSAPKIGDLQVSSFHFDLKFAQFDLGLHLYEEDQGYVGRFEYCTDLFEARTVERLSSNFQQLLRVFARNPWQKISELPLLSVVERSLVLDEWNQTGADYPAGALVHELFEAQVKRAPSRTALTVGAAALSYAALGARAARVSRLLRARGIGRGQRVGLCVERGADMVAAMLGILKAGAAYVPLDPSFPTERLRFMAEDAGLALLVSTTALSGTLDMPGERQLLLDAAAAAIDSAAVIPLPGDAPAARPEDPAYVIYTSGSTGRPKGVVVPHRAVVNFLTSMAREPGLTENDVLVAVTTLSFDIAVLELLLPVTLGATVVIAAPDEATDGRALSALLDQHRATVMQATPVTWRMLVETGWTGRVPFKALVGGEALPKDLADQLIARGVELWNLYGPTETTVWSTCARITDPSGGITIGRPIANTSVRILDARKNLSPIGVPGELYIGGDGVALGYWNRPELTAERFIPDPFSTAPGATLYRTGDRARWCNDGTLEHLGRLDDQVKVRGFRIELGEIETVLAGHPDVHQAAVHLWTVKPNDMRIVACCVPARGGVLPAIGLRKHLRARLPEYMIPQYFLAVDEFPLTPNGKIDRRRLPTPVVTESRVGQHDAPADPVEAAIAEIWTKLIQPARPIVRSDKFFEMGGYSLLGLRALRLIEEKLGKRLEFVVLFQETLADIAARCRSGEPAP
ncbi:MAG: amino acid adenylation domain-containing protein [Betaproteobacteria bacterium]|nr:amino acid adenylation domain-containing protein [Betaproteobacteria bacterium]